jgi:chemotaxis protein CheX
MEQGFIDILKQLVKEQVKDVLTDSKQCKALLADYTRNEYKKESRLLVQAVEAGVAKAVKEADDLPSCKKAKIRDLVEEYGLSQEVAAAIVDALALVLRGDTSKTETEKPAAEKPSAEKSPASSAQSVQMKGSNKIEVNIVFRNGSKFEQLNPFVESAYAVLKAVMNCEVKRDNLYLKPATESATGVTVKVDLAGDLQGRLLLEMSKDTALFVAGAMNMDTFTAFDEIAKETIKELARMIAGQAVHKLSSLGIKITVSEPTFFDGDYVETANLGDIEALACPFELG